MELSPDIVLKAYASGMFPMADSADSPDVYWVDPDQRGILSLDGFHISKRLKRTIRQSPFRVSVDTAFEKVMQLCAQSVSNRKDTWINETIFSLYSQLHTRGNAHSIECWHGEDLVGGLYGVRLGGAFFGESMFHRASDASKIALAYLVARLRVGGFALLDTQFITDHLMQFGTTEIPRVEYQTLLAKALPISADFYRLPALSTPSEILQSATQRS